MQDRHNGAATAPDPSHLPVMTGIMDAFPEGIPLNLLQKLVKIMGRLDGLEKKGHNAEDDYDFARESDVTRIIRDAIRQEGVFCWQQVESDSVRKEPGSRPGMFITTLWLRAIWIDTESGEYAVSRWPGAGEDSAEKGIYKAETGALKYMLMKMFLFSAGDDPEKAKVAPTKPANGNGHQPAHAKVPAQPPSNFVGNITGTVEKVEKGESQSGTPYRAILVNSIRYGTTEPQLFEALDSSTGKVLTFISETITRNHKVHHQILEVLASAQSDPVADPAPPGSPPDDVPAVPISGPAPAAVKAINSSKQDMLKLMAANAGWNEAGLLELLRREWAIDGIDRIPDDKKLMQAIIDVLRKRHPKGVKAS